MMMKRRRRMSRSTIMWGGIAGQAADGTMSQVRPCTISCKEANFRGFYYFCAVINREVGILLFGCHQCSAHWFQGFVFFMFIMFFVFFMFITFFLFFLFFMFFMFI
jgi:hypothetical protein